MNRITVYQSGCVHHVAVSLSFRFLGPHGITNLTASTLNTTAVHLYWARPNEYNSNYRYWVKTTGCGFQNETSSVESVEISALTPGTNCTFCVFVMAANGIKGEERCTSNYTSKTLPFVCLFFCCHHCCPTLIFPLIRTNRTWAGAACRLQWGL